MTARGYWERFLLPESTKTHPPTSKFWPPHNKYNLNSATRADQRDFAQAFDERTDLRVHLILPLSTRIPARGSLPRVSPATAQCECSSNYGRWVRHEQRCAKHQTDDDCARKDGSPSGNIGVGTWVAAGAPPDCMNVSQSLVIIKCFVMTRPAACCLLTGRADHLPSSALVFSQLTTSPPPHPQVHEGRRLA